MFDDLLRALKDRLFHPTAIVVGRWLSPNALSLIAFAMGAAAAIAAANREYGAALACWLVNRLLDGLDGSVARATGRQTDFGGYLDIILDFTVYAALPLGLVYGSGDPKVALAGVALVGSFFINAASWMYLAAILERRGQGVQATGERTTITMPPGLVAGAETVVLYTLFLLLPGHLALLFMLMTAGVAINIVQRLVWALRHL
ncbi:MAG: CDP-alcohol phosphatidyltransferase family protein [Gemmatimonadaceae bacterium]|nr:CDP-alcohol phosphatidyltransferase family protein [Gemmatimonadaceae bacterium]